MPTVVLDFDSTLVPCESLERAIARGGDVSPDDMARIEEITRLGMSGELAFRQSLEQRLDIAAPRHADLIALGEELAGEIPDAAVELVRELHGRNIDVWLVSGALRDVLLPGATRLGIPHEHVLAVGVLWQSGHVAALVDDGFPDGKVAGVRRAAPDWTRPSVVVGDGATDRALRDAGLVEHFVAFVGHVRRQGIADDADRVASDFAAVAAHLEELLA